jgi:NAD+ synthase (glutamine-hydrolysing)
MPSAYSASQSARYAEKQAAKLGVEFREIPISEPYEAFRRVLSEPLGLGADVGVTLENIQARIRGDILMAFSNEEGYLVLSTGNKSELSVGYCTLYGDMTGGLAVLSDVPKTLVYELAEHINREEEIIPTEVIERPPSAELRPNQKDEDSLPPYPILDEILKLHVEDGLGLGEIVDRGFARQTVEWTLRAVRKSEYKRRQAAPGLKVTTKAFGSGRRMPIAAHYAL